MKKITNTEIVIFVYDAGGKLVAEYSTQLSQTPQTQYLTNDHLGSPRINTDELANVVSRSDYLPYGEDIIGLGGRSSSDKYVADDVRQGFTGYIKDDETGLDFAQARMYKKELGRFTGADPIFITKDRIKMPQKFNLYVYVGNSPLRYVDPDGKDIKVSKYAREFYIENLEKATPSFNVSLSKSGKVKIVDENGKALNKKQLKELGGRLEGKEKELFNAITDQKNHVKISATRNDPRVFLDASTGGGKQIFDLGDIPKLSEPSNTGGLTETELVAHGTIEAYRTSQGDSPVEAHNFANNIPGAQAFTKASAPNLEFNDKDLVVSYTFDAPRAGDSSNVTRIKMVLPKPTSELDFVVPFGNPEEFVRIPTRPRIVP